MQACEGYVENGQFYSIDKKLLTGGRRRAFLMVLDEPAQGGIVHQSKPEDVKRFVDNISHLTRESKVDDQELRAAWLKRLDTAIDLSLDEELPDIPRSALMREPIDLVD